MGVNHSRIDEAHAKAEKAEEIAKKAEERAKRAENDVKNMAEDKKKAEKALVSLERTENTKLRVARIESRDRTIRTRTRVNGVVAVTFYGNYNKGI